MVSMMFGHLLLYPYGKNSQSLLAITHTTNMARISYSIPYDAYAHNITYPEMPTLSRMDLVYEH